ncbi:MAG TPA: SDR family oxidoreductase [Pyrinomonadaceae bacterium]|jgi:NAD(P)-dependent dehydrogenase (short-subunit alcohol dehydrogenase family)
MPAQPIHAFAEKVTLITDGTNPTGRAVALQLALLGSFVVVGFSGASAEAKSALEELKSLGTLANAVEADASTVEGAQNLVAEVEKLYGRIDLLVNTLKFEPPTSFAETSENVWQTTIDTNLKSVFFVTQAALPLMSPRPKPSIVNVVTNCEGDEKNLAFAAAQAAVAGLTKQLSKQLPKNFRVNCVAVNEKREEKSIEFELFKTSRNVAADDVARVVVYLLSAEAKALSGQILTVDRR